MQVPGAHGLRVRDVAKRAGKQFLEDDMLTYAAALSYHVFFALFPFIIFLVALLSFLDIPEFFDWLLERAQTMLPGEAMEQVEEVIGEVRDQRRGGLLSLGILLTLWTASVALRSTMNALNNAYDVGEGRPTWKRYLLSILYTLALAGLLVTAVGLMVIGPQWIAWLAEQVRLGEAFVTVWAWARIPVAILLAMFGISLVYQFAPNVEHPYRLLTPGAVLAVLVWVLASLGFGWYVRNFADYSALYGSVGAVVILLFYFFISGAVMLFGAEVNAVIETHRHEVRQGEGAGAGEKLQPREDDSESGRENGEVASENGEKP